MANMKAKGARAPKMDSGQSGGRRPDPREKGDLRRQEGGPGQQGGHGQPPWQEAGKVGDFSNPPRRPKGDEPHGGNRDTHADKQQPKESGPGRASRTRPRDHFDERS